MRAARAIARVSRASARASCSSKDGGALPQMLPPFRFGAGGPVGSGRQYWPWIHRDDWIALVRWAIATPAASGAINATAPQPVTNAEFARALGRAMHRPAFMPAPGFALKLLLGEMADGAAALGTERRAGEGPARRLSVSLQHRRRGARRDLRVNDDDQKKPQRPQRALRYLCDLCEFRGFCVLRRRSRAQPARPTRYLSPVGAGTPPSGSSVTAIATGAGRSSGVSNRALTRPLASGVSMPALIGAGCAVSTQS